MAEEAVGLLKDFYATGNPQGAPLPSQSFMQVVSSSVLCCLKMLPGLQARFLHIVPEDDSIQWISGCQGMKCMLVCCSSKAAPSACSRQQGES